jgi:DNA-directed RNA polymerase subunit K/omega
VTDELLAPDSHLDPQDPPAPDVKADEKYAIDPNVRRFLFVDIAAQRAKQLRKGALNRLELAAAAGDPGSLPAREIGLKPERIAMEEVRRGFIRYELPEGSPLNVHAED